MEPGESSPSPWNSPSLVTVPVEPLSSSPQNPESPTLHDSTLQSSCSPAVRGERTDSGGPRDGNGERGGDSSVRTGTGGTAQRSPRPSAFPSSLAWDSDSEKETLDEEELQHFSNPHGLAAHSPGSPASGHRQERADSEGDKAPEKLQHLIPENDPPSPVDGQDQGRASTQRDEPKTAQPSSPDSEENGDRELTEKVSPEPSSEAKPKDGHRKVVGEKDGQKGKEEEQVLDVYSFPGDSDPESPPPAPWAHCTFTQRRKRKRALLKPFSGLGTWRRPKSTSLGVREGALQEVGGGVFEFTEEEENMSMRRGPEEDVERESVNEEDALCQEVFTCVECSIYFKKQVHLQEHMQQHLQSSRGQRGRGEEDSVEDGGGAGKFQCSECGWELEDREALTEHRRQHQESRQRILAEISKLNEDRKGVGEPVASTASEIRSTASPPPRLRCPKCNFGTDSSRVYVEHAKMHIKERNSHRARGRAPLSPVGLYRSSSSSPTGLVPPLPCELCSFQASSHSALREHRLLSHPSWPAAWDEEQQEEGRPGTSRDFLSTSHPPPHPEEESHPQLLSRAQNASPLGRGKLGMGKVSLKVGTAFKGGRPYSLLPRQSPPLSLNPPRRRDVAFKSIGNRRKGRGERLGTALTLSLTRPKLQLSDRAELNKDQVTQQNQQKNTNLDSKEVPALALQLKRSFSDSLRGASESLGLTEGQQTQLRRMLPLVLIEPFHFSPRGPSSVPGLGESVRAAGLANHVRGHLNRVGVSYNVRHFISPEEVNAIERKFSYQKKRKKVANFDPDTFSLMRCEFCSAGFDTRAGLSSHARAHLRDFGITNWEVTVSPINILRELFSSRPDLVLPTAPPRSPPLEPDSEDEELVVAGLNQGQAGDSTLSSLPSSPTSPALLSTQLPGVQDEDMPEVEGVAPGSGRKSAAPSDSGSKHVDTASLSDEADSKGEGEGRVEIKTVCMCHNRETECAY
ncbi:hypothetical protein JZ751_007718 [Albula glossodonta]|uniref:C2H2-type domain-containing protein n=1 Tax=Albula glossodonta TaxID=121402 RepID=A0A8T2P0E0_9TELE|nr:hypothetical protein JZ751_007718 [Albula glossodonta]